MAGSSERRERHSFRGISSFRVNSRPLYSRFRESAERAVMQ